MKPDIVNVPQTLRIKVTQRKLRKRKLKSIIPRQIQILKTNRSRWIRKSLPSILNFLKKSLCNESTFQKPNQPL
jgi:hypothetical protein